MTTVVNFYGAPGSGKSTGAAHVFSKLKLDGVNCEYVSEFAKDKCWEQNKNVFLLPENQFYIGANQFYKMYMLKDKVDVIVTDSPIYMNAMYNKSAVLGKEYNEIMFRLSEMFNNINFFINRVKPYHTEGRNQTEKESNQISIDLKKTILSKIPYIEVNGNEDGYEIIYQTVKHHLTK